MSDVQWESLQLCINFFRAFITIIAEVVGIALYVYSKFIVTRTPLQTVLVQPIS